MDMILNLPIFIQGIFIVGLLACVWVGYEIAHSSADRLHLGILALMLAITCTIFPALFLIDIAERRQYDRCVEVFLEGNTREQAEYICKNP